MEKESAVNIEEGYDEYSGRAKRKNTIMYIVIGVLVLAVIGLGKRV